MTTEYIPRREPCTTCGLDVTIVRLHPEGLPQRPHPPVDNPVHTVSRGYLGERVDAECNLPEYYRT